jgi:hypothetical protein
MDYSFLDDPNAIAEILATAEPEHRAMQSAQGWDDKTLAIEIVRIRHKNEEEEWEDRVMRMSDEDLEMEDDIIRAKIDPDVKKHRAMSEQDKEKNMTRLLRMLKWAKRRLNFTKGERDFREEKKRYSLRLSHMSDEDLRTESNTISEQCEELYAEHLVEHTEEIRHKGKYLEAKYRVLKEERTRRGWSSSHFYCDSDNEDDK